MSDLDPVKAINHFLYNHQLSGYGLAYGANNLILMSIHPKTKKIKTLPVPMVQDFWIHNIKQYGTAA